MSPHLRFSRVVILTSDHLKDVMIRIGITKEFSLEIAPIMMEQLDEMFGKGIYTSFTDTGVYFSIEIKPFISRVLKEPYWKAPDSLRFYRWVLVVGQHQAVSCEFKLHQFIRMTPSGKLVILPYICKSVTCSIEWDPHIIFNRYGELETVEAGMCTTEDRVLERVRQMGILDSEFTQIIRNSKE